MFRLHTIAPRTLAGHIQTNNPSIRVTNSLYIYIYIYTYMHHEWVKNMFWLHTASLEAIWSKVTPSPGGVPIYYVPPGGFPYLLSSPRGGFLLTMFQNQVPRGRGPPSGHLVQIFPGRSLSSSGCLIRKNCKYETPPGWGGFLWSTCRTYPNKCQFRMSHELTVYINKHIPEPVEHLRNISKQMSIPFESRTHCIYKQTHTRARGALAEHI